MKGPRRLARLGVQEDPAVDDGVGARGRQQAREQRAADIRLDEVGALQVGGGRPRVDARQVLDVGLALEPAGDLRSPGARDSGDHHPAAGWHALTLSLRFRGRPRCGRTLEPRSRLGLAAIRAVRPPGLLLPQALLDLGKSLLEGLQTPPQLRAGVLTALRELGTSGLATTGELAPRLPATARELVDQLTGTPARRGDGRPRGGLKGAVDGFAKGVADAPLAVFFATFAQGWEAYWPMTDHLRPSAEITPLALLPGDPARAMALAQDLLERPLMANHARGLWGYSGTTAAGIPLTVQSTGIGGPSLAVVLAELAELGVERAIRIGTCRAVVADLEPGDLLVARAALPYDGASRALGAGEPVEPDPRLASGMLARLESRAATIATADLHHDPAAPASRERWLAGGAEAVDLATATALALGPRLGVALASALVVAEASDGRRASDELVEASSLELGRAAAGALAGAALPAQVPGPGAEASS
jgi:uridine phosphorylase